MVQTRTQANAPSVSSTKSVVQKATPKIARIPIKTEKEKDSKALPSRID